MAVERKSGSILSGLEHKVLNVIFPRLPQWVTPDLLTFFALISALFAGIFYYLSKYNPFFILVGSLFIFFHWFGDSLDGGLARYRHTEREKYGYYVDHMSDMFAVLFIFLGLGLSDYMGLVTSLGVLILFLLLSINSYLITYSRGVFYLAYEGVGGTELRVIIIFISLIVFLGKVTFDIFGMTLTLFDIFGIVIGLGMLRLLLMSIYINVKYLAEKGE